MKLINHRNMLTCALTLVLCACGGKSDADKIDLVVPANQETGTTTPNQGAVAEKALDEIFESIRQNYNLPALSGVFINGQDISQSASVGTLYFEHPQQVSMESKWHLGSITKSMTATLAGRLVEGGFIRWDSTVSEVFPSLAEQGHVEYRDATLTELLSHTAGMAGDISAVPGWDSYFDRTENIRTVRREMVSDILRMAPGQKGRFQYSNAGYVVAGAMLEEVTGEDWESLMQHQVFIPLEINDAGFGAPEDDIHPSGHTLQNGSWQRYPSDHRMADNPRAIGPAGTVHMSLPSLAKYAIAHMQGVTQESGFLSMETFEILHREVNGSGYAMGWFLRPNSLFHDGSNTRWFAKIGINVEQQIAAISVTNAGGNSANSATDEAINEMLKRHTM